MRVPVLMKSTGSARALEMQLQYDSAHLTLARVRLVGSASKALVAVNNQTPGSIQIALASSQPLDSGSIAVLEFKDQGQVAKRGSVRIVRATLDNQ